MLKVQSIPMRVLVIVEKELKVTNVSHEYEYSDHSM